MDEQFPTRLGSRIGSGQGVWERRFVGSCRDYLRLAAHRKGHQKR